MRRWHIFFFLTVTLITIIAIKVKRYEDCKKQDEARIERALKILECEGWNCGNVRDLNYKYVPTNKHYIDL